MTEEKFQLGRHLFYDTRLSSNGTVSCASCHEQDKAFSDGVDRRQLQIGYQLPLAKNHGLRLSYKRILNDDDAVTESSLAYRYYY